MMDNYAAATMKKSLLKKFPKLANARFWLWLSAGAFCLWGFLELSYYIFVDPENASGIRRIDRSILLWQLDIRKVWLTEVAVGTTSLGSVTVLMLGSFGVAAFLWLKKQSPLSPAKDYTCRIKKNT